MYKQGGWIVMPGYDIMYGFADIGFVGFLLITGTMFLIGWFLGKDL